ncbi:uncharacterized protein EV420DRAFT_1748207 [Desarmillaria tabescens]|uniref:F-box domain-containing protein n=1 Tax=Armillaria tabescens TaxID=1929756 RepID=A0AA39N5J7_ARMTA|nr:uncharacterized protein EV420DRAFT_1748207 [Desarmillaria tabescens]KAK0458253.1 hypothetical protein EV420DRAFT_1748207 [Desarmillaria tabescens]
MKRRSSPEVKFPVWRRKHLSKKDFADQCVDNFHVASFRRSLIYYTNYSTSRFSSSQSGQSMPPKEITLCQQCRRTFRVHDHALPPSLVTDLRDGIQISADVHADSIKQTLDALLPKLCEYDAKIEALEETLAYLKKGRADLAHSISVYKACLAPIRRLPVELLCKIFSEACAFVDSPIDDDARETFQPPSQTPFRIASVCSYWRGVCLSVPQLWSVMFIDADDTNLLKSTRQLLSLYQQRSCSKPVHVGISAKSLFKHQDNVELDTDVPMPPYMSLKTIFSPSTSPLNLSSCRSLFLDMGLARQSDLALPSPDFASLGRLYLTGWFDVNDVDNPESFSHLFSNAPRLRELHLHDTWILQNFDLNWSHIRTLRLTQYDGRWDDIVEILDTFPRLDVLMFYGGGFQNMTAALTIPGIRVLQICGVLGLTAGLLHVLTLPDLRRLELLDDEVGYANHITTEDVDIIVAFLASSSFLNEVRFDMTVIQDVDLIRILETVPKLTKVAIVEPRRHSGQFSITDKLLGRMMDLDFSPKLEELELVWAEDNAIEEGKVLDVIKSRCGQLQSVIVGVRGGGELDKKTLRRIQEVRELRLSVFPDRRAGVYQLFSHRHIDSQELLQISNNRLQSLHDGNRYQHFDDEIIPMLHGNHIKVSLVKSAILAIEGDIQSIDDRMDHLEALKTHLLAKRSHAAAELAKYRSFIAPVRRLPNEILSEIFSFTCTVMSDSVDVVNGAPWVLSRVCSLWRSICLSSSRLWSTVIIVPTSSTRRHAADILGSYLDRSRELLLNLYLDGSACIAPVGADFNRRVTSILRILRPHISRWHKLILSCDRDAVILDFISAWKHLDPGFTHLKRLDIRTPDARDDFVYPTTAFSGALNLESIHLGTGVLLKSPSFPHLTSFYGTFSSILQFHDLLDAAPSLQDVSISYHPPTGTSDIFPPTQLTHTGIHKVTVRASSACFSKVIFPLLEELVIDAGVYESNFDPQHVTYLTSLMSNSHHPRRSLNMMVLSESHLTPFLSPGLTSLTLEIPTDTSREIYRLLMYNPDSSYPVAPNLTHLSIKEMALVSDPNLLTDDACLKMIRSRARTLQSVILQIVLVFHYSQAVSQLGARPRPLLSDFKSIRSTQGLDVRIRWTERTAGIGAEHDKDLDLI